MKKLLLFLTLIVGVILQTSAQNGYTIEFANSAKSATEIKTTTKASTFIAEDSRQYLTSSPVSASSKVYYGGTATNDKASIRFGTAKAIGKITLNLSELGQIPASSIIVSAKKYSSSDNDTEMTVCGQKFTVNTDDYADYTISLNGTTLTTISLETAGTDNNRVFVKSITVVPGDIHLGELTATYNGLPVEESLTVDQGDEILFHADNATSFSVTVDDQEPINLTATNGEASWTPAVCTDANVSVIAKRETEDGNVETSDPLTFTLTVNKPVIGDIVATYGTTSTSITANSPVTVDQGTIFKFQATNATNIAIKDTEISASGDVLEWTPDVCENQTVTVIASREGCDSKEFSFTLTVNKVNTITATWIITSAPSTISGNTVDVDLTLDTEKSSAGKWHAYAADSYSSGISGGAQLGSSSKPFRNGTISLTDSDIPDNAIIKAITFTGFTNSDSDYTLSVTVNEVSAGTITVAKTNTTDHTLSDLNLTGNQVTFTTTSSAEKYLCVKGISIKYALPAEPAGEIVCEHVQHFQLEEYAADKKEIKVMAGTELTFTSENADHISISSEAEGLTLPEAVDGNTITWTAPSGLDNNIFYDYITVTATRDNGSEPVVETFELYVEEIEPQTPEYLIDEDEKYIYINCGAGALNVKVEEYTAQAEPSIMRVQTHDWMFPEGVYPKEYELDYTDLDKIIHITAKAVTPLKESEAISFYVDENGAVSGIENVAADTAGAPTVYYNLQGQRVEADRPGMYIRRQGGKAEKIVIR